VLARLYSLIASAALTLSACERPARDERHLEPRTGRPYRLIVPRSAPPGPRPVLFALHAYATAPEVLVDAYSLVLLSAAHGFVLVVPEGRRDALGNPHWNASPACCGEGPRTDDLAYLRAVLSDLERHTPVDASRVAAIGVSNGAFMAQRWAAEAGGELGAVVSICGAHAAPSEHGTRPVSLLHVHGTDDAVVRYGGGEMGGAPYPSVEQTLAFWRSRARCADTPQVERRHTLLLEAVDISTWQGPEAVVSLWRVGGGDHRLRAVRFYSAELVAFLAHAVGG
jgi:polyhydroxybutyrate depolymerase